MTTQEKLKSLLAYTDRNGKRLEYVPEGNEGGKVYLDIDGERRYLGFILIGDNNIAYHKYEKEANIFRANDSWSINQTILQNVDLVVYETELYTYHITKEEANEFGAHLHFENTTELKVYVPLKFWGKRSNKLNPDEPEFKWRNRVGDSWYEILKDTLESDMMKQISAFVKKRRAEAIVYPESDKVFRAYRLCSFEHTKVVLVGMSPYHDGSADGLAFSYREDCKRSVQKSLEIIYKEIERDVYKGLHLNHDFDLRVWAKQGVLLLNSALTVEKGKPESHFNIGWERFVRISLYKLLCDPVPKAFAFWGNKAQEQLSAILTVWYKHNQTKPPHLILTAKHPAADLYKENKDQFGDTAPNYPKTFSGCGHFSQINKFLKDDGRKIITW